MPPWAMLDVTTGVSSALPQYLPMTPQNPPCWAGSCVGAREILSQALNPIQITPSPSPTSFALLCRRRNTPCGKPKNGHCFISELEEILHWWEAQAETLPSRRLWQDRAQAAQGTASLGPQVCLHRHSTVWTNHRAIIRGKISSCYWQHLSLIPTLISTKGRIYKQQWWKRNGKGGKKSKQYRGEKKKNQSKDNKSICEAGRNKLHYITGTKGSLSCPDKIFIHRVGNYFF